AGLLAGGFFPIPWVCLRADFCQTRTRTRGCHPWSLHYHTAHVHQRCVGSCSPRRNALISVSASAGLLRGTRWPAPRTVTMLKPWYSTNLPATCIPCFPPHF